MATLLPQFVRGVTISIAIVGSALLISGLGLHLPQFKNTELALCGAALLAIGLVSTFILGTRVSESVRGMQWQVRLANIIGILLIILGALTIAGILLRYLPVLVAIVLSVSSTLVIKQEELAMLGRIFIGSCSLPALAIYGGILLRRSSQFPERRMNSTRRRQEPKIGDLPDL